MGFRSTLLLGGLAAGLGYTLFGKGKKMPEKSEPSTEI